MISKIPTIDFDRFLNGSSDDRRQVASKIDDALRSVGFFYLVNHGIDQEEIDTCFEWSRRFFKLPEHEKSSLSPLDEPHKMGYVGVEKEKIRGRACMKEEFGFSDPLDDRLGLWPGEKHLPGFRDFASDFYRDCVALTKGLLECASLALDLPPEESLGQYHTDSTFACDLIHYPAVSAKLLQSGEGVRCPAHSDTGTFTLLFQKDVGGLEVADMGSTTETATVAVEQSGKFIHVEPKPGAILVNVGYLLMRWTNGHWKNTVHRVSGPPRSLSDQIDKETDATEMIAERFSTAFFSFPDATTIVKPLASCCNDQRPTRWGPLHAGRYRLKKKVALHS